MIEELNQAYDAYKTTWDVFQEERSDTAFFESLKPTAVGWKTTDLADYDARYAELRDVSDHVHAAWLNGRWIAVFHLRENALHDNIRLIKLMQRRPNSEDAVGLDHVDFYSEHMQSAEEILEKEPTLQWTHEQNGLSEWISIWFAGHEAKLRNGTTIDVCIEEFKSINTEILE